MNEYIDIKSLSTEWEKITGDSSIVDIRKVTSKPGESMIDSLLEVFKYSVKFSEMDLEQNYHIYEVLQGIRLQSAYGNMWGVKVPENEEIDPLTGLSYYELYYEFRNNIGSYEIKNYSELKHDYDPLSIVGRAKKEFVENRKTFKNPLKPDSKVKNDFARNLISLRSKKPLSYYPPP